MSTSGPDLANYYLTIFKNFFFMKTGPKNMAVSTSQRKGADVTLPMQTIPQRLVLSATLWGWE